MRDAPRCHLRPEVCFSPPFIQKYVQKVPLAGHRPGEVGAMGKARSLSGWWGTVPGVPAVGRPRPGARKASQALQATEPRAWLAGRGWWPCHHEDGPPVWELPEGPRGGGPPAPCVCRPQGRSEAAMAPTTPPPSAHWALRPRAQPARWLKARPPLCGHSRPGVCGHRGLPPARRAPRVPSTSRHVGTGRLGTSVPPKQAAPRRSPQAELSSSRRTERGGLGLPECPGTSPAGGLGLPAPTTLPAGTY